MKRPGSRIWSHLGEAWAIVLVSGGLALLYALTRAPGVSWANYGMDGGDFLAAAATLGVPHPTGYPTYTLLLHWSIDVLRWAEPAVAGAMFSEFCALTAVAAFMVLLLRRLPQEGSGRVLLASVLGLMLGLSPLVWSQASIVEVHGLHLLFMVLGLWFADAMGSEGRPLAWTAYLLSGLMGLGMGNHVTLSLVMPVWAWLAFGRSRRGELTWRQGLGLALAFLAGLGIYAYLPLRAAARPPINWGVPDNLQGFLWTVTARPYQGLAFGLPVLAIPDRISAWSRLLLEAFGLVGVFVGIVGLLQGRTHVPALSHTALWIVGVFSLFAIGYNTADSMDYLIPVHLGFAWFVAQGAETVRAGLAARNATFGRLAGWGLAILLAANLAWIAPQSARQADASQDRRAMEYGLHVMREAPPSAVILTWEATDTFPLWYYQYARGMRPDLAILVVPLMQFDWYYEVISSTYPGLGLGRELFTVDAVRSGKVLLAIADRPHCQAISEGQDEELRLRLLCTQAGESTVE